jgi:hypothetical protein
MKLTLFLLLLPWLAFFGFVYDSAPPLGMFWIFTILVCLVRGIYVFRLHRLLAFCCFAVALVQIFLVLLPELMRHRHSV